MKIRFPRDAGDLTQTMGRPLSPYRVDENGWTDLHYAAALNLPDSARNLLVQGAGVDAPLAADGEQLGGQPLKVLRRYGFRFHTWEREGDLPLHLATWSNAVSALCMLIDFGADVRAKIGSGWTALHIAARFNAISSATPLAAHGADVASQDRHGWTALHAAVRYDSFEMAEFLLDQGAPVNAPDENGMTPLHFAVIGEGPNVKDTPRFARLLLERGADVNALTTDEFGVTPLDMATTLGLPITAGLLGRYGGDVTLVEKHEMVGMAHRSLAGGHGIAVPLIRVSRHRRKPCDGLRATRHGCAESGRRPGCQDRPAV